MRELVAIVEIDDPDEETDGSHHASIEELQSWILSVLGSYMAPRFTVRKVEVREVEQA